ncbi:Gfo/Idh/MocA family protein [Blastococcus saxobsidens]|uniref:Putative dehydrogenase n=1 Tax=Blastococcus saxobsidens TaxID=138336 RepID=A0A4Q7Y522_9ACTN|nr:Gfo/Idh/MocA family oxidoreductase [Blastococcus saxobsidens]RZU32057.1 putative dehydrogenase [Blastococcus saxobsidens]
MSRLRWGIVGTGGISRTTAGDLHLTENLDLVAVASRTAAHAEAFAAEFDVPRAHGDYDALFADDQVDVVYICTPIGTHAEVARRALLAGKHVLLEKAFTTTAAEARGLAALAAEEGRFLMEAMWMRFNPMIQRVLDEVAAGVIGDVRTLQAAFGFTPPPDRVHWRPDLGGGALLDMGVYPLTLAHLLLGIPDRVEATGEVRDDGLDMTASVFLRYGDGRFAHALTTLAGPIDAVAAVGGTRGVISLDPPFFLRDSYRVLSVPEFTTRSESVALEGRGYVPMFRAVGEALADGLREHPLRPLADTIAVLDIIDDVRRQLTEDGTPA